MGVKLISIAKELNVATSTIVEFLKEQGYKVSNRPNFQVSEDMQDALYNQYSVAREVKEKADKMKNAASPKEAAPEAAVETKTTTPEAKEAAPAVKEEKPAPVEESKQEEKVIAAEVKEEDKPKLKVLGKIDLEDKGKPKKKKAEAKKAAPEEEQKPAGTDATDAETTAGESAEESQEEAKPEELLRAETPQLKGLKIMGKIDSSKLEESKPKKKKAEDNSARPKRKRTTRKKVSAQNFNKNKPKAKKDEIKEISQKEIEEKIKATMARLGGGGKRKRQKIRRDKRDEIREKQETMEAAQETGKIEVTEFISVSDLANLLGINSTDIILTCMNLGVIVSINQRLDAEIIELIADEHNREVEFISAEEQLEVEEVEEDDPAELEARAPIVTVMGHVDHGKTSLLDYIREEKVVEGEAGGITQHIGAYEVAVGPDERKITFLDTPGHEAFTAMRARGAKVTDIAVIIVAADDNIMPQTKEAISHAQAAGVPMVFAINKIDKPGADPERIKQELASMNLMVEDWGGKYQSQDISAKQGTNIDLLLEKIILEADLLELQANPNRGASGTVVEASLDKGRGYVAKLLVQNGTLKIGDFMLSGEFTGKVKAMYNERGKKIKFAGPSSPVLVLGLSGAPQAGETFRIMENEQDAKQLASKRAQIVREQSNRASKRISLDEIGRRLALGNFKELNLIVKGDVDGSIEALSDSLIKLSQETVQVNVIHKAVGQIIESDVLLASASDAIIIGFQVRPSKEARQIAEKEGIQIRTYSIIYEAIEEIKSAIEGMLEPTKEEKVVGQVEVQETYKISKIGTIAGCKVTEGKIFRNSSIRLIREGVVVYPTKENVVGEIASLKRFKEDVKEVRSGMECGISIKNFNDIKVGDVIEAYEIVEIKQYID